MRLSDIQPQFFPRLHYFARMLASDIFVLRDDVQFVRNHKYPDGNRGVSYQAHTPIKTPEGIHLLPVSIKKGGLLPINETQVSYDQPWTQKQINILKNHYGKSPNAKQVIPEIELLLGQQFTTVGDLNIATTCWGLSRLLGVEKTTEECFTIDFVNNLLKETVSCRLQRIALGSDYLDKESDPSSTASERIVALCKEFEADEYLGGGTAIQAYVETELFEKNGVKLQIQDWDCPTYPQQHDKKTGFIANLSIIDLLMNVTAESPIPFLMGAQVERMVT